MLRRGPPIGTTIELKPTGAYRASKEALSADLRREVDLVEEGIAVDPYSPLHRFERFDGTTVDTTGYGVLVAFEIVDDEFVRLVELADLTQGPA